MPRDPRDISVTFDEQLHRKVGEFEDDKHPLRLRIGAGPAGAEGKEGKAGAVWYSGTTVPSVGLGLVGDFYLRTTTSDVYKKTGESIWSLELNIKGATGTEGVAGAPGKEGPAGSAENIDWKNSVRAATTANIATATALNPGDTIDGVVLAENDRVLVKDQTTKSQNGIWIVKAVPSRALDADAAAELSGGSTIYVEEGTKNKRRTFQIITPGNITPGTTAHEYQQLGVKDFGIMETLPTSEAIKGDVCTYVKPASFANMGLSLIYDGEGARPWLVVGGPNMRASELTTKETTSATPQTSGAPSITAPLSMLFRAKFGCNFTQQLGIGANEHRVHCFVNAVEKASAKGIATAQFGGSPINATSDTLEVAAAQVIQTRYSVNSGTNAAFDDLFIEIEPLRVG